MSNINKCSSYHHLEVLLSPHPATPVPQFCDKVKIVQMAGDDTAGIIMEMPHKH